MYERDAKDVQRKRDWNMGLHWAAPLMRSLIPEELYDKIQTTQVDPRTPTKDVDVLHFYNGATGEVLSTPEIPNFYRLRRSKIRRLLMEGLNIHEGIAITAVSFSEDGSSVTASFSDGTTDTGSLLIGTDGPHSTVRSLLVGAEKARCEPIDFAATMCFTHLPRDKALFLRSPPYHPLFQCAPHPEGYFAWLGLHDATDPDPETWTLFHYISYPEPRDRIIQRTPAEYVAHQKELAKKFADPFRSAFEWMPDDTTTIWNGKMQHWDPGEKGHQWDNHDGRTTLAGDAAHPMTFQRGQGLNHAVKDAYNLANAIAKMSKPDTGISHAERKQYIDEYEKEMIERGGEEVRLGEMNSKMLHDWEKVMHSPVMQKGLSALKKT